MQTITITGYLSRDAEQRQTQGGKSVTNWNVPVKQGWGDNEQTNWYRVAIWGKRADFASNARKGEFVTVTGELVIGEYNGKPQYEIQATDFHSVRTTPRDGGAPQTEREPVGAGAPSTGYDDLDDDVPFISDGFIR